MSPDTIDLRTNAVQYETVPCPLCEIESAKWAFTSTDVQFGGAEEFKFVRCTQCGLYYMNPRPVLACIGQYYPGNYYSYSNAPDRKQTGHSWKPTGPTTQVAVKQALTNRRVGYLVYRTLKAVKTAVGSLAPGLPQAIRLGAPLGEPGSILDIGCGAGHFLDTMKLEGWETWGVDISGDAARTAESRGHHAIEGDVTEIDLPRNYFDAVRLWHTLEHVHDPVRVLEAARACLKPGGSLIIGVPNVKSLAVRWFGRYWMGWDIPRHMWGFSPSTLRRVTEKSGYRVTGIWTYSMPIMIGISFAWKRGGRSESLDELSRASRLGCSWAAGILTRMRQGDVMTLHAIPIEAQREAVDAAK
jgi:SAM-dependent methyltransferase